MREMVFRERQERVSHMEAIAKMIARVFNVEADKAFGGVVAEYAAEVFQETYDQDLLKRRIAARRAAQAAVRARRERDLELIKRLDRMGDYADKVWAQEQAQKKQKQNK